MWYTGRLQRYAHNNVYATGSPYLPGHQIHVLLIPCLQISYAQRDFSTAMSAKDVCKWELGTWRGPASFPRPHVACRCPYSHDAFPWAAAVCQAVCPHAGTFVLVSVGHGAPGPVAAAGFYAAVRKFVVIIIIAAPLFSFTGWVEVRWNGGSIWGNTAAQAAGTA